MDVPIKKATNIDLIKVWQWFRRKPTAGAVHEEYKDGDSNSNRSNESEHE